MEFRGWLKEEGRPESHLPGQKEFSDELEELIRRARNPALKQKLEGMRERRAFAGDKSSRPTFAAGATENEPFREIISALRREEAATGLSLVDLFGAMLAGRDAEFQRARFGQQAAAGRGIVVRTIEQYAMAKNVVELVQLVRKFRDYGDMAPNHYKLQQATKQASVAGKVRSPESLWKTLQKGGQPQG